MEVLIPFNFEDAVSYMLKALDLYDVHDYKSIAAHIKKEVEKAFTFWGTPEGDLVHPAECMEQLIEKVRRQRVNIDGNVCTVMVTTLVLEFQYHMNRTLHMIS
ncbi:hypothetical protein PIB30_060132 [Stylosanthes scabra]|uniref:Uncharacterized protein n=1 Tax=Stylosanthes scabra TaxID=79078 RepID=A0ABU6YJC4_9FABA|nr:hypothetical protein [Stylosanthes scabra]